MFAAGRRFRFPGYRLGLPFAPPNGGERLVPVDLEAQTLTMLGLGPSNSDVADQMCIAPRTRSESPAQAVGQGGREHPLPSPQLGPAAWATSRMDPRTRPGYTRKIDLMVHVLPASSIR